MLINMYGIKNNIQQYVHNIIQIVMIYMFSSFRTQNNLQSSLPLK
jgi:hypothetical protein